MQLYFKEARTIVLLRNHFFFKFWMGIEAISIEYKWTHYIQAIFFLSILSILFFPKCLLSEWACSIHSFQRRNKIKQNPSYLDFSHLTQFSKRLEVFGSILIMYSRRLTCPILFRMGNVCWRTIQINKLPMADYFTYNINANK